MDEQKEYIQQVQSTHRDFCEECGQCRNKHEASYYKRCAKWQKMFAVKWAVLQCKFGTYKG